MFGEAAGSRINFDMVQKKPKAAPSSEGKRPRGRPRGYDPERALERALETFWTFGYSRTSLDDLSAAMGMNRPSVYAAFGDKQALYLKALDAYWGRSLDAMRALLSKDEPLATALMRVYDTALTYYFPKNGEPRGCFGIGTAAVESVVEPRIRTMFYSGLRRIDQEFERRMRIAQASGQLSKDIDATTAAQLAAAVLHSLALRARSGSSRAGLRRTARAAISVIVGSVWRKSSRCVPLSGAPLC
jgi:AcrR family transcriptional regulator